MVNSKINCIDFVKPQTGGQYDEKVIFRTCPTVEAGKLIFQLGTASPELAVEAAKIVVGDVAGIDVNSGCPKVCILELRTRTILICCSILVFTPEWALPYSGTQIGLSISSPRSSQK